MEISLRILSSIVLKDLRGEFLSWYTKGSVFFTHYSGVNAQGHGKKVISIRINVK